MSRLTHWMFECQKKHCKSNCVFCQFYSECKADGKDNPIFKKLDKLERKIKKVERKHEKLDREYRKLVDSM